MVKTVPELLEAIKKKSVNVAKLSKETGIPDQRIYKWGQRGSKITAEDAEKLKVWISEMDKSPENIGLENGKEPIMPVLLSVMRNQDLLLEKQNLILDKQKRPP